MRNANFLTAALIVISSLVGCGKPGAFSVHNKEEAQKLPSGWIHKDDVEYFAPGPEFQLSPKSADAAQQAYDEKQDTAAAEESTSDTGSEVDTTASADSGSIVR